MVNIKFVKDTIDVEIVPLDNVSDFIHRFIVLFAEVLVSNGTETVHDDLFELLEVDAATAVGVEFVEQVLTLVLGQVGVHTPHQAQEFRGRQLVVVVGVEVVHHIVNADVFLVDFQQ